MNYRIEKDSMGEMQVPADKYWAAQTQRSLQNFKGKGRKNDRNLKGKRYRTYRFSGLFINSFRRIY